MPRRTILLGLTGDPPHIGHFRIATHLSTIFDRVFLLPVYRHMFKEKRERNSGASFVERVAMLNGLASQCGGCVEVSTVEETIFNSKLSALRATDPTVDPATIRVGTADVLKHFDGDDEDYHFCMGGDVYKDLVGGQWRRTEEIKSRLCDCEGSPRLHVVDRGGDDIGKLVEGECQKKEGGFRATFHPVIAGLTDVSSTEIRELIGGAGSDRDDKLEELLGEGVFDVIKKNGYYNYK